MQLPNYKPYTKQSTQDIYNLFPLKDKLSISDFETILKLYFERMFTLALNDYKATVLPFNLGVFVINRGKSYRIFHFNKIPGTNEDMALIEKGNSGFRIGIKIKPLFNPTSIPVQRRNYRFEPTCKHNSVLGLSVLHKGNILNYPHITANHHVLQVPTY